VFNILLQVMEEGQLTDNYGRRVDFRNTVLIMTSNVGCMDIKSGKSLGFVQDSGESSYKGLKSGLLDSLKKTFNPEFLNRLDDAIVFRPLGKEDMRRIIDIMLGDFMLRLHILDLSIEFTPEAKLFLMDKGFDPALGARPLRRAIQKYLEDPLSEILLKKGFNKEAAIQVGAGDDQLTFEVAAKA
jgi:ATP-dependent Clp protease ATP-binding subunit ClpC